MCTLTIIPQKDGFILTSNRDEAKSRKLAQFPVYAKYLEKKVLFPQDGDAKGSWIAMNESRVVCLLNGAYKKHKHQPPYRKSRGIVLLDCFNYANFEQYTFDYNFNDIEPFTIVCLDFKPDLALYEFQWDGLLVNFRELNPKEAHIISSVPLYPKKVRKKREELFTAFLDNKDDIHQEDVIQFHRFGGSDTQPKIQLDESHFVQTVSITSVLKKGNELSMDYYDLIQNKQKRELFKEE